MGKKWQRLKQKIWNDICSKIEFFFLLFQLNRPTAERFVAAYTKDLVEQKKIINENVQKDHSLNLNSFSFHCGSFPSKLLYFCCVQTNFVFQ